MRLTRKQILGIGPLVLVATCYAIAAPSHGPSQPDSAILEPEVADVASIESMPQRCKTTARMLQNQLGFDWTVVVHEPFVIGGDLSIERLELNYHQTIVPTFKALSASYFQSSPRHPITIVLCSSDSQFRECNMRLDSCERNQYSGLYHRKNRRMIVNISTGEGTQAHELTHALAHADFPRMPEWFDEGLASLHEECEFSADGLRLIGNENWRNAVAREALNSGELRLLEDVASRRFGSSERANLDYACVRSFCLYLQHRGLLESFYERCHEQVETDPTGLQSLCDVARVADPKSVDDDFRKWLIQRSK